MKLDLLAAEIGSTTTVVSAFTLEPPRLLGQGIAATQQEGGDVAAALERAVEDPVWDVVMLGFHMMNQNVRAPVLARCLANNVGTLCMFAVRNIFSRPGLLQETIKELAAKGKLPAPLAAERDPLGFLLHAGGAESLTDAAYRFARHEPGVDVVLFGTGNAAHLKSNIQSILRPALPATDVQRLYAMFHHLVGVGFDLPDHVQAQASPKAS